MRSFKDPLNLIALATAAVWSVVGIWFRPIGDYGVETDFYGDFLPFARQWLETGPAVMLGYRGPFYYLVVGALSRLGDPFLLAKILAAACAGISLRVIGGLLRRLWNPTVAVAGCLFLAANPTLIDHSFRAGTDLVYLALFAGAIALIFNPADKLGPNWAAAGVCAGLAYLTRYNGAVLVPVALVACVVLVRPGKRAVLAALTFGGAWLAVAAAWLVFLWQQTGDPFWNRNFALIAETVYSPDPGLANLGRLVDAVGFASFGEVVRVDPGRFFATLAGNLARHAWLDAKLLVGWVPALIALAGWAFFFREGWTRRRLVFAAAGLLVFVSLLPVFYNQRFMLSLLIWWAAGFGGAIHQLLELMKQRAGPVGIPVGLPGRGLVLLLVLTAVGATAQGIARSQGAGGAPAMPRALLKLAAAVRETGTILGPDTALAARKPHLGYYLGTPVVPLTADSRLNELAPAGIHYLLVSDIESRIFPHLAPMLSATPPTRDFPGFRFLAGASDREGKGRRQTAALYAVLNPGDWQPTEPVATWIPPTSPGGLARLDFLRNNLARWYLNWTADQPVDPLFSRMDPASRRHPVVLETAGDALLAEKNYQGAIEVYEELRAGPGDPVDTLLRLSLAHFLAGDREEFTACVNEYAGLWKRETEQTLTEWFNRAAQMCRQENYVPAAGLLNQVLAVDPEFPNPQLQRMLGYCYLNYRHPERAREAFRGYLTRVPADPEIRAILLEDARLAR
jgi:hypothetical protein